MADVFKEFKEAALAGMGGLDIDSFEKAKPEPASKSRPEATPKQQAAVEASQRMFRLGRGVKKHNEPRKLISFNIPETTIKRIDELHFKLGKSKQELYEEAFADLLAKYIDI